jgi:hypothetical protein
VAIVFDVGGLHVIFGDEVFNVAIFAIDCRQMSRSECAHNLGETSPWFCVIERVDCLMRHSTFVLPRMPKVDRFILAALQNRFSKFNLV